MVPRGIGTTLRQPLFCGCRNYLYYICYLYYNYITPAQYMKVSRVPDLPHTGVCVLPIEPYFLPVDIELTQCPCRFFLLERFNLCGHKTTTQRYYIAMQSAEYTMHWPAMVLDTTGTTCKY